MSRASTSHHGRRPATTSTTTSSHLHDDNNNCYADGARTMWIKKWSYSKPTPGQSRSSFIEFTVLVRDSNLACKDPVVYEIHRRFSQFHALHKALRDHGFALPDMPTFDMWTNVLIKLVPDQALRDRQAQLQHVLDCISGSIAMQATAAYKAFVGTPSPDVKWRYTSLSDIRIHPGKGALLAREGYA
ncbi:hypothetical protein H310_13040 [Aphanomyces invadans]|uniref:PX domain-containing protein n=1 Tax=Aphanomyces invadans TaxID=157072 RepID=A0A024TFR4_9STRA|nr:hypothetical protein H310_13040 [Aphanomyces invadans]ETV92849.1 hypothetical protein H310_13040 [Aphanomyces invadans]|eukprot:XP_008878619.1 hypothetical protein H310_13040 [Aphanomyces invadans]